MKKYVYGYYAQKFKNETPPPKKKVNPIPITSNSTNKSDTTTIWLTPYENEMRHAIDEGIRLRRTDFILSDKALNNICVAIGMIGFANVAFGKSDFMHNLALGAGQVMLASALDFYRLNRDKACAIKSLKDLETTFPETKINKDDKQLIGENTFYAIASFIILACVIINAYYSAKAESISNQVAALIIGGAILAYQLNRKSLLNKNTEIHKKYIPEKVLQSSRLSENWIKTRIEIYNENTKN